MNAHRTTLMTARSLALGAALVSLTAVTAAAQRELFSWSGRVDQEIQLTMSGRNLTTSNIGRTEPGQRRAKVIAGLPREDGFVRIEVLEGRGSVEVTQQPTSANGFTSIVSVRDPQGGAGDYRIRAFWEAAAGGEVLPPHEREHGYAGRMVLRWSGDVDEDLEIQVRPRGVDYRTVSGKVPRGVQSSFTAMPSTASELIIHQTQGRGNIAVVQQPTPENEYTALVRVRDPQAGYGHYSFEVSWR